MAEDSTRKAHGGKNSRHKAEGGQEPYLPELKPSSVEGVVDTINMWSCYLKNWGKRMDQRVSDIEHKVGIHPLDAPGTPTTHLDPPPDEPYTPPPA